MPDAIPERTLRLVRTFEASRERVFAAWTDPAQFAEWFGPAGVKVVQCDLDVRPGGGWQLLAQGTEGRYAASGRYIEVKDPERLVFTWAWHETGDFAAARGHESTVTLDFRAQGRRTEMTMLHGAFAEQAGVDSHNRGWTGSFAKLDAFLARSPA